MSKLVSQRVIAVLMVGAALPALPAARAAAQNFVASNDRPVPGQPVWKPSFAFPKTAPASDAQPWRDIDPIAKPGEYSYAVLNYFMEGQNTKTWRVQDNPVRKRYHMPWMQSGTLGS